MKRTTAVVSILISLTLIGYLPNISPPRARGLVPPSIPTWSPFGPREQKLTITDEGDFTRTLTAFQNGQVDITDFPLNTADISSTCSNPDFYCTSPTSEFGIFYLDINHGLPFLGVSLQDNRTAQFPSFVLPAATGPACANGFGQLTVSLENQEEGNSLILDSLNRLTISNQPSGSPSSTVGDFGGSSPTGAYVFPCILAGTYKISSSVYGAVSPCAQAPPTVCISIGSGQLVNAVLRVDWNSPSTKRPSQAGILVGAALAHMIDKPSFVQGFFGATGTADDEQVAPSQSVPDLFSNTAECSDHPWFSPCNPVSAYNFVSDSIAGGSEWWTTVGQSSGVGPGYSGVADLRASCDDLVRAGFTVVNAVNATDCGDVALTSLGTTAPATSAYPHLSNNGKQLTLALRTSPGRFQLGLILADTLNFLFGTPNGGGTFPNQTPQCTVNYLLSGCKFRGLEFVQVTCVFQDSCSWNLYTGGADLGPFPDLLYSFYHSSFASSFCGGPSLPFDVPNYPRYCDPQLDTYTFAGEFDPSTFQAVQLFARAAAIGATNGMTVPFFSRVDQFAALNGWNFQQCAGSPCSSTQSSLVNTLGHGFDPIGVYWSLLNMRQVPGIFPPGFAPGGGDPNLIRLGFSQDLFNPSPFQADQIWEVGVVRMIFDSMLQANPLTGGTDGQIVDWQTTSHSSTFNPTETGCNTLNGCVSGVATQLWHLRNDANFQDGTPVTAADVAYTLIAYRDVGTNSFFSNVANLVSAVGLDCGMGQSCKTLQVKLQGNSPLNELNIGTVPIIPKHVWAPFCGDPPSPTSVCADPTFDPMAQGIMIGDGPWACVTPSGFPNAGHIGGSCTVSHNFQLCQPQLTCLEGGSTNPGDQIFLTRSSKFVRCCPGDTSSSLYKISYADRNNDGVVNILDLASVASSFGTTDPYWVNPNIAPGPTVNAQDLATVAIYFGHGVTYPKQPSQLTQLDPQIDPFFCSPTVC